MGRIVPIILVMVISAKKQQKKLNIDIKKKEQIDEDNDSRSFNRYQVSKSLKEVNECMESVMYKSKIRKNFSRFM